MNSVTDAVDASPGDGVCVTATPGECTLRAAVQEANASPGSHEISLPAGTCLLTIPGPNEDAAATGDLDINGTGNNFTNHITGNSGNNILDGQTNAAILGVGRIISRRFRFRGARSVRLCALLDKHEAREVEVPIDYCGFRIGRDFVVGYGLDYAERYRNLPYIGVVEFTDEEQTS